MERPEPPHRARQGERLSEVWSQGDYERIAERFASIHEELVARLQPGPGVRCLDVATGTGEVALRAARAGADVAALDISPKLLAEAQEKAAAEGLAISFDIGDAQRLPFGDAAFDVVSSSFGVIFAPDQEAAARELGRVCRPGGRVGLTAWRPKPDLAAIFERFQPEPVSRPEEWGSEEALEELLGDAFDLEISTGTWYLEGDSPEDVYEFMAASAPPTAAFLQRLEPEQRAEFRNAMLEHWSGFCDGGRVREPREYLVVVGTRR